MVKRVFVEKKEGFRVEADNLLSELNKNLHLNITSLRIINCYDVENLNDEDFGIAKEHVLSEINVDTMYEDIEDINYDFMFRSALLKGQYDQRADSAEQCVQMITGNKPKIHWSKIYIFLGNLSKEEKEKIKKYLINPVECEEIDFSLPLTLSMTDITVEDVKKYDGFKDYSFDEIKEMKKAEGFAMSEKDLDYIREYFEKEGRDPFVTELKVIDTYWSDHCRHTTFLTEIEDVTIDENKYSAIIQEVFEKYKRDREELEIKKPVSLMDLATISVKKRLKEGVFDDLDSSEEINACSINAIVDVDGKEEDYLIMFKNETHNHPTEIEPFGGAATCLGGAIRDPLSGRAYVYQGMRITGSGDPRIKIEDTIHGKLPQYLITKKAAEGFSSYGNQIGLATGFVREYYHEGFLAKRMEVGAVIAATRKEEVIRKVPEAGDVVLLVGGLTGRDGCGGATGSSKIHTEESISTCSSEVQKGNPPEERKLQRLFRNEEASKMIKRCNDFGAGGVSVAVGEIADSLDIYLDNVLKKYEGLDGTELAISESQERMAVTVAKEDVNRFIELSNEENLEAVKVADVTDTGRLTMRFREQEIFNIKREFLDTNGIKNKVSVKVEEIAEDTYFDKEIDGSFEEKVDTILSKLNASSQKGLIEHFDSTIGANTVLMPFGGKYYNTPIEGMVSKVPVKGIETTTATIMTHGYNPDLCMWSPFHGAMYAVVDSIAKIVSIGGDYKKARLSFQEYFEKLEKNEYKWGKPLSALLGAYHALDEFKTAAIGGKDSMSGTFNEINVPPTLISFAVAPESTKNIISPEIKKAGSKLVYFKPELKEDKTPNFESLRKNYELIQKYIREKKIISAYTVNEGGVMLSLLKMSFGNKIGVDIKNISEKELFYPYIGGIICEVDGIIEEGVYIGDTIHEEKIHYHEHSLDMNSLIKTWESPLKDVFPIKKSIEGKIEDINYSEEHRASSKKKYKEVRVCIPVFPGTNCEDDTKKAFEKVGAKVTLSIVRNLREEWITKSIDDLVENINKSQILAFPGGFSAGDEPDGSGKFIASVFKNEKVKTALDQFIENDGLIIGICNGFQALIKLGLLPYGKVEMSKENPTLTYNKIGRHISRYAKVKVASNMSPWLKYVKAGDVFETALSHGEGRFYASDEVLKELIEHHQIATQYVSSDHKASYDGDDNPNGSFYAIEGITSRDGRIFGKMGHIERIGEGVAKNIYGKKDMMVFKAGVDYFKEER